MARVLIVDDRPDNRELLATIVRWAGHDVIEAPSGERALALAREHAPDVLISDVVMPGMDGYELVRRLRSESGLKQPRVLFCTANYLVDEAQNLASACGVLQVLVKPVEPKTILAAVASALETGVRPMPEHDEDFDRSHLRLVNRKLFQKVSELEVANADRRRLLGDLVRAQEVERKRIAVDIHDDSLQVMAALTLRLELLAARLQDPGDRQAATDLAGTVSAAIGRLRRLTFDLRPRALDTEPLSGALGAYLHEIAPDAGFEWELIDTAPRLLPEEVKTILFRIAQEALRNVDKHARARRVELSLQPCNGGVELRVTDDGRGFEVSEETVYRPGHLGLASMRERSESAGGRYEVHSAPGTGTTVRAWVPLAPGAGPSSVGVAEPDEHEPADAAGR